jgi:hypothetical protein
VHIQPTPFLRLIIFFLSGFCCSIGERENRGFNSRQKFWSPSRKSLEGDFLLWPARINRAGFSCFRKSGSSLALLLDPLPLEGLDESGAFFIVLMAQGETP